MAAGRRVQLGWAHGVLALGLAVAALYVIRHHAAGAPLLQTVLMPPAALALCIGVAAILLPVTTGRPWVLHHPPATPAWRLQALAALGLLWASFALPATVPYGASVFLNAVSLFGSVVLLLLAVVQGARVMAPLLAPHPLTRPARHDHQAPR